MKTIRNTFIDPAKFSLQDMDFDTDKNITLFIERRKEKFPHVGQLAVYSVGYAFEYPANAGGQIDLTTYGWFTEQEAQQIMSVAKTKTYAEKLDLTGIIKSTINREYGKYVNPYAEPIEITQ